jgi:eukaryotic-like serine/threonine-protein kinase
VKPGNVLIDRRGTAKILDMGLARFYNDQTDNLTVKYDDKIVLGTADYVAPEQVANSHGVDVRADIYALGASLYFLLAGHPPFPQGAVSQKLLWHRTKDPTPIRQLRPEVPEGLAAVVQKMMMKDPNRRFQSPADVAAELERWVPLSAQVPLPAPEEMPALSPAAQDTSAPSEPEPEATAVAESAHPVPAAAGGRSFGPQSSGVRHFSPPAAAAPSPFGPPSGVTPFGPPSSSGYRDAPRSGSPVGGYRNPSAPSPFGAPQAEIPTNGGQSSDPTPADTRVPLIVPTRSSTITKAVPPAHPHGKGHKYLIVALLATCALLATGMAYFGFMYMTMSNPGP